MSKLFRMVCSLIPSAPWKQLWQEAAAPKGRRLMPALLGAEKQLVVPLQGAQSRRGSLE